MSPPLSLLLFSLSLLLPISSSQTPIHLDLHRLARPPHPDPFQKLAGLVSASLLRARHLKNPKTAHHSTQTPLFPHSYGGYSISLNFGTPPQKIPLLLDTGSHLVWIPCTTSYLCKKCSSPSNPQPTIPTFFPKSSSSSKLVGCKNPKCTWIHPTELLTKCRNCPSNSSDCSQVCPPYVVMYGSGSTGGLLLSETLDFPNRPISDFAVGCSVFSDRQPAGGIAGFGRGPPSLPAQLGLKRFTYCLIPRRYDDEATESGALVLDGAPDSSEDDVQFTPFLKNPAAESAGSVFSVYYYVGLRKVTVGGRKVKIPHEALIPGPDGNGGTIVDSGTTFTYMEPRAFDPIARAVSDHVAGRYNRSVDLEDTTGLRPCFAVPVGESVVRLPKLVFHFKGGAAMRLPVENYFAFLGSTGAVCLTVVSDGVGGDGTASSGGPSIILGNFQQQNYYMVYDLVKERLGFRQKSCVGT